MSSARSLGEEGRALHSIIHNRSTGYSNKQAKHKHCYSSSTNFNSIVKTQVIRPPLGTAASPVSIQVRLLMWATHPAGPSGNSSPHTILHLPAMSKNMGLTQTCWSPAHLGLSFGVLSAKGCWSSQLPSLAVSHPKPSYMEWPLNSLGRSYRCFAPA